MGSETPNRPHGTDNSLFVVLYGISSEDIPAHDEWDGDEYDSGEAQLGCVIYNAVNEQTDFDISGASAVVNESIEDDLASNQPPQEDNQ